MAKKSGIQRSQNAPLLHLAALPRHQDYFDREGSDIEVYDINYPWFWQTVPSKQEVRLYSDLPLDIVRTIFDMAMWEDPKAVNLLLVSREVKSWVEPLLYKHLHLSDQRQIRKLYHTYRMRKYQSKHYPSAERGPLPLRDVRTLVLGEYHGPTFPMFKKMTGLERVEFWHDGVPFIFDYTYFFSQRALSGETYTYKGYKNIRHLSLSSTSLHRYSMTFDNRAFRNITHLDMYFNEHMTWGTLYHLHSLTHLALDMAGDRYLLPDLSAREYESWVSALVTVCPPNVQAFIICCIDTHNEDFDLLDFIRNGSEPDTTDNAGRTRIPSSVASNPRDIQQIPLHQLQFFSRLASGKVHPRVVVGSAVELHNDHTFRNGVVYITYKNPDDREMGHDGMRWAEADNQAEIDSILSIAFKPPPRHPDCLMSASIL